MAVSSVAQNTAGTGPSGGWGLGGAVEPPKTAPVQVKNGEIVPTSKAHVLLLFENFIKAFVNRYIETDQLPPFCRSDRKSPNRFQS